MLIIALCHYYPPCPQPELTIGTPKYSDNDFFTVLLQDHIGGLQVLYQDNWIDVKPVPGALIVNVGDLLQACFLSFMCLFPKTYSKQTINPGHKNVACLHKNKNIRIDRSMIVYLRFYRID